MEQIHALECVAQPPATDYYISVYHTKST